MPIRVGVCLALGCALGGVALARQQAADVNYGARPASAVRYLKAPNADEFDQQSHSVRDAGAVYIF